nr:hypothetical protein [Phytohabitans aurantiacus]
MAAGFGFGPSPRAMRRLAGGQPPACGDKRGQCCGEPLVVGDGQVDLVGDAIEAERVFFDADV